MKTKNILTGILLLFVAASVVYLVVRESGRSADVSGDIEGTAASEIQSPPPANRVIAYYFHGNQRCPTCRNIEAYTKETIQSGFVEELADGTLELRIVNVDEPANEHFVSDFQLTAKSVVLVNEQNGEQAGWKNLEKIWDLVSDKESFVTYIRDETRTQLEASN